MLSIVIPAYNEAEILADNLGRLRDYLDGRRLVAEVIVVSNGSTDATDAIGKSMAERHGWLRFFSLPNRAPGLAFVRGVEEARNELVVSLDMDLSSDLVFLDLARELLGYCDMVVGSKTLGGQRRSPLRVIGSQTYILLSQLLLQDTMSDYSMGAKAYRRSAILPCLRHLDPWTGFVLEIAVYLRLHGRKVLQVGVDCNDPRPSHFNLLYEGVHRFRHLYRCFRLLRSPTSWLHPVA